MTLAPSGPLARDEAREAESANAGTAGAGVHPRAARASLRFVTPLLFAGLALWVLAVFPHYGLSNDEPVQQVYGELLWAFYASGFSDTRAFSYINLYLYGGLFDLLAVALQKILPLPIYETRHLLSATFGLLGLFGANRLARLLGGEGAGILAVLLLAVTGMYGGAMFTHTKDVPFAAMMVWALYFTTRIARDLPRPLSLGVALGLGLSVGAALGLRVGGVFAVFYLVATLAVAALVLRDWRLLPRALPRLVLAGLVAFAVTAASWPWSVMGPTNLLDAATKFNHFAFDLKTLFAGRNLDIDDVPRTYMVTYLAIKLPEITLLGVACALGLGAARLLRREVDRRALVAFTPLMLALAVPVAFTLADRPPLYNGIRHFLFVLPPVSVVGALGLAGAWALLSSRPLPVRAGAAALASLLFAFNLSIFVRLHPFEYAGYNNLVGGLPGAIGRYEGDYWSQSVRDVALKLHETLAAQGPPPLGVHRVAVCAEDLQAGVPLGDGFVVMEDWQFADFFITASHIGCDAIYKAPVMEKVTRMGVTLGVVQDLRGLTDRRPPPPPSDDDEDGPGRGQAAPAAAPPAAPVAGEGR